MPHRKLGIRFPVLQKNPVSPELMRKLEQSGEEIGISRLIMMENAAGAIARYVSEKYATRPYFRRPLKVLLIGGSGNNGGDVFAAARHLAYWPSKVFEISVFLIGNESDIKTKEASLNWSILRNISRVKIASISSEGNLPQLRRYLERADVVIVGIFGTGFHGEPRGYTKEVIDMINKLPPKYERISVDVPSGLEAGTGRGTTVVQSDTTITMHAPKKGMFKTNLAKEKCGRIIIANIGLPF